MEFIWQKSSSCSSSAGELVYSKKELLLDYIAFLAQNIFFPIIQLFFDGYLREFNFLR